MVLAVSYSTSSFSFLAGQVKLARSSCRVPRVRQIWLVVVGVGQLEGCSFGIGEPPIKVTKRAQGTLGKATHV